MKFLVNRANWRCGGHGPDHHGHGDIYLNNEEGFMCCLGFACQSAGLDPKLFINAGSPEHIPELPGAEKLINAGLLESWDVEPMVYTDTQFVLDAIEINDAEDLSDQERETRLQALAKEFGHEFEFTGEFQD